MTSMGQCLWDTLRRPTELSGLTTQAASVSSAGQVQLNATPKYKQDSIVLLAAEQLLCVGAGVSSNRQAQKC